MINKHIEQVLLNCNGALMIPKESCVTVREGNTLLHALLLLSNVKHSEIPVLNDQQMVVGRINMPLILQAIKTETEYVWDDLAKVKIIDAMDRDVGKAQQVSKLEDILHSLVNYKFCAIEDSEEGFQGIVTRREILTRVNFLAHEMDSYYDIIPGEEAAEKFKYPAQDLEQVQSKKSVDKSSAKEA